MDPPDLADADDAVVVEERCEVVDRGGGVGEGVDERTGRDRRADGYGEVVGGVEEVADAVGAERRTETRRLRDDGGGPAADGVVVGRLEGLVEVEVGVRVDKTGDDGATGRLDDVGLGANHRVGVLGERGDAVVDHGDGDVVERHRLRAEDPPAADDEVGRLFPERDGSAVGHGTTRQREGVLMGGE